ncbi:protein kinase domain-containing protein [Pyxidicoccus xibeiensis]|uniref:protein kinase domain-containing protein n=1 Tax=Pyxidicoccus xibeiensis TaxID=2906759 RepID=UPI0020A6DF0A|nr:protein kinase [Pyxidicoccus xibeiensis]MCP3137671.1 protein kinase [Pyxidicoccus xibeiensis]
MLGREPSREDSDFDDSLLRELRWEAPPAWFPVPGESLGGADGRRYQVLDWLGGGGMGQVFRARDETLQREVALKFLLSHQGFDAEVLREARAIARLDHDNIVRIFDVSEWMGSPELPQVPFLVMECLEGESLAALLKRGRLDARRALEILDGIAAGLAHAHERHLIHRDLKPSNVFLTPTGVVKLLDFGLSHLGAPGVPQLSTGGTPAYMAPEQWRGETQDARTDVWAAGLVLYEMLTGVVQCSEPTLSALRTRVMSAEPMPPVRVCNPEVPPEVEMLLATALAKDPVRRFPSAVELRREVRELRARLARPGAEETGPLSRQRRQLVLLSCQLTGFADLARRLDAEDLGELETAFHQGCVEALQRYGGSVNMYMGGEVYACFGCRQVREDDAERAARAALSLARELPELLQRRLTHLSLSGLGTRVGLHTDRIVLDTRALHGEAPRVVSWIARQAAPGEVLTGETTWKQVRGAFETEDLGARDFSGIAGTASLSLHRVLREREARVRFERTLVAGGLTPLVGREQALQRLLALWEAARDGRGAFVLVRGEAGIGKSRLIQELHERVPPETAIRVRLQCWSQFSAIGQHPAAELLQRLLGFAPEDSPQRQLEQLEAWLDTVGMPGMDAQLLGLLLGLPVPKGAPVFQLTCERWRELTHVALVELLLRLARQRPMLLVVEDVHWADASWLEFLGALVERIEGAALLVVLSARPEFQRCQPARARVHELTLERLPAGLATTLVKQVAHGSDLPEETVRKLVEKTDGIPLFIEEMTRRVLEGGAVTSIPATLHDLLLSRLDVLPSRQKALAQLCAVVGRSCCLELLAIVTGREPADVRRELAGLMDVGLLQEEPVEAGAPGYRFRHALFQDAAYQSLTRGDRRAHHRRIAQVLVEHFPDVVEDWPEAVAHHFSEGGEPASATLFWSRAGLRAFRHKTIPEAEGHLLRALELLRGSPEAHARPEEELPVLAFLGFSQALIQGFDSPEAEGTVAQACSLLPRVEEETSQLTVSYSLIFSYYTIRADLSRGHELSVEVMRHGERHEDPALLSRSHQMQAFVRTYWGRPRAAVESSERALAFARPNIARHGGQVPQEDKRLWVEALAHSSLAHSALGRLERAREHGREAVLLARRMGEPATQIMSTTLTALASLMRGDVREALSCTDEVIAISSEQSHWLWPDWARVIRGWALAELGQSQEALALVSRQLERLRARGVQCSWTLDLAVLAGIHLKLGQVGHGVREVNEALGQAEKTGERCFESELRRLLAELLRARGQEREARSAFFLAIAVARAQGMLLFELRAMVGLTRLLRDMGHPEAARNPLARVLARFDAGEDSADLREARALVAQLSADDALGARAEPR